MKKFHTNYISFLMLLLLSFVGYSQETYTKNTLKLTDNINQQKASINDVKWLKGDWLGTGFGNSVQEVWTQSTTHSMLGMFQMLNDDKVIFYEIFHLIESDGSLLLELKHFNADLTGWEEKEGKVTFPLIKIEGQTAWFDGLTYQRKDNKLFAWVAIKQKDGSVIEGEFKFSLSD